MYKCAGVVKCINLMFRGIHSIINKEDLLLNNGEITMTIIQPVPDAIKRNWGWLFALGLLFIVLGTIGLSMTVGLTLVSMLFFGVLLLIGGCSQIVDVFKSRQWRLVVWHAIIAILYILAGSLVIYDPFIASTLFTGIFAGILLLIGCSRVIMAISMRHMAERSWVILAGVLSILLGTIIFMQWPWSGLWIIGLFIAIELLMNGWTYVFLALAIRRSSY